MNWNSNIDPTSSGRSEFANLNGNDSKKQNEINKLKGDIPETFLQLTDSLAAVSLPLTDPRITLEFDSSAAEKVARAIGHTSLHAFEAQNQPSIDQTEEIESDDEEEITLDFEEFEDKVKENSKKVVLEDISNEIKLIGSELKVGSVKQSNFNSIFEKFQVGVTLSLIINSNGKLGSRQPSIESFDFEKFALFNQESKTVVYAGYDEKELEILKQDPILRGCSFIGVLPENVAIFKPFLLQIIHANKTNIHDSTRDERVISSLSGAAYAEAVSKKGIKEKEKSEFLSIIEKGQVILQNESKELKEELIDTEKKYIEQVHIEEAEEIQKERQIKDREKMIRKKELERVRKRIKQ